MYSWDIVAERVGDLLFLSKRDTGGISNPVDALTVSETSIDPPPHDHSTMNNAKVSHYLMPVFYHGRI